MEAFAQTKQLSYGYLIKVGAYLCCCRQDFLVDSKCIIKTQKELFDWFDFESENPSSLLVHFKSIIQEFKINGNIDSGTKIKFIQLLKDLSSKNVRRLRNLPENLFVMKVIQIKFDLNLTSLKDFCDSLNAIDNCALKYIEYVNDCKIYLREENDLKLRNFLGEVDASIEARSVKELKIAEQSLRQLVQSLNYRLTKKIPTLEPISLQNMPLPKSPVHIMDEIEFEKKNMANNQDEFQDILKKFKLVC